ncbi:MAG TPA: hypothetical protein VK886_19310 [Vicinamibacterales bacterium]|nr:hypothetical protein [Vicinamibacterales bacterium]
MEHQTRAGRPPEPEVYQRAIQNLRELIAALDARVPRLERAGEVDIARDASALREEALQRIAELGMAGVDE